MQYVLYRRKRSCTGIFVILHHSFQYDLNAMLLRLQWDLTSAVLHSNDPKILCVRQFSVPQIGDLK